MRERELEGYGRKREMAIDLLQLINLDLGVLLTHGIEKYISVV